LEIRLNAGIVSSRTRWRVGTTLSVVFRVVLLATAILVIRHELYGVGLKDLFASLRSYGLPHVALGLAFTAASFLMLGILELLALRYVGKRAERIIPRRTAIATAFVAHAYSQSIGLAILTGTAVRVRSYSRYGLDALDVARLSVFVTVTAALGLLTTGALAFISTPGQVSLLNLSFSLTPLGLLLLLPIIAYIAWGAFGRSDFHGRGRWRIRRPTLGLALEQIAVSSLDWLLAGTVLFFLMPPSLHVSYSGLLGVYLVAQTAAVLSHVPGGVGVFEAIVLALLTAPGEGRIASPTLAASVVASLFVYRVLYYLLPLCGAIGLSGIAEFMRSRRPAISLEVAPVSDPLARLPADAI
jgi:glycosyltransferase 2 family protein